MESEDKKIEWSTSTVSMINKGGETLWTKTVRFPVHFSDLARKIVSEKYFKSNETDFSELVERVARGITDDPDLQDRIKEGHIKQYFAFNSPVYFNIGCTDHNQLSACFIQSLPDTIDGIMEAAKREALIFKSGSGSGMDYSRLRSSRETVRDAGRASGPVSFLKLHDTGAGVIRSGGVVRRSAKMAILDIDHGDIRDWIRIKPHEERKLQILAAAGIRGFFRESTVGDEVSFQNTNLSVAVNSRFLERVRNGESWNLVTRETEDKPAQNLETLDSRELLREISSSAWTCGEPGIHYRDTINDWHTCPHAGPIRSSNPCSEFFFIDDSACNLAVIDLVKVVYKKSWSTLDEVVETLIRAQDAIVDRGSYPTPEITQNSHRYRPLGLGITNLGGLLMLEGLPYDSPAGRYRAGEIMNRITSKAYRVSAQLAHESGAYEGYSEIYHYRIIQKHRDFASSKGFNLEDWDWLLTHRPPLRNAQVTLIQPAGTVSFLLDSATTGCEPEYSLVRNKHLVGGGELRITNPLLRESLLNKGYDTEVYDRFITSGLLEVLPEDRSIWAVATEISIEGHLQMMATLQGVISGSISKTVNMPANSTVEDVETVFLRAGELGLKSIIIYREGSKSGQVMTSATAGAKAPASETVGRPLGVRIPLPDDRPGGTHKFSIGGSTKGYINYSTYEDGALGEIFTRIAKEGSTFSGFLDTIATLTSIALQYNVPLEILVDKMLMRRFEPAGWTSNPDIRFAHSIVDYIFRYLGLKFLPPETLTKLGIGSQPFSQPVDSTKVESGDRLNSTLCPICGGALRRLGSCDSCVDCGWNGGTCS